jgi:ribonuclease BN (tRNA processing enzyme)
MLDAHFITDRRRPLLLAGPRGLASWYARAMETAFAGSTTNKLHFPLTLLEIEAGRAADIGALRVTPFAAQHDERAGPCLMLRIEVEGRVIAYSGDTEWTDALVAAGRNADLFICEASARHKPIKTHLALDALERNLGAIAPKRLVLTHMGDDILMHRDEVHHAMAEDGMVLTL